MNAWLPRVWLALLATLSIAALLAVILGHWPGVPVRTNIMELLPALRQDTVLIDALARSNQAVSRKLLILVGNTNPAITADAAETVTKNLQANTFFSEPLTGINASQTTDMGRFYFQWRHLLLSDTQHRWLTTGNTGAFQQQLTESLYSPISGVNGALLSNDPMLTFYHFIRALPGTPGNLRAANGHLEVPGPDRDYRVIVVDIQRDVFDMTFHPTYAQWRTELLDTLRTHQPGTDVLLMGAVQHAVWGASSARQEVSTIGNGSLLGIVALILLVFGMNRSLVIALLPLGTGIAGGLIVTLFCFGHVHLITLVFGSSVIGVAMDYSLHYLTEHYKTTHPEEVLSKILPGITLAMVTSLIAYAAIGFAPFPVLRQVALFSCAGLFMSWMTVISLFPHTLPPAHFTAPRYLRWSGKLDTHLQQLFDRPFSRITLLLFALAMLPGVLTLRADDDLRLLQAPEAGISAMEKTVRSLTGIDPGGRFFLIEGNTIEQLLQRSEALKEAGLEAFGTPIETLATYLPSQLRQKQNFDLQQQLHAHMALDWQQQLGLASSVMEQAAAPLQEAPAQWLDATQFLASPAAFQAARFQLTATDRGWIAVGFVPDKTDFSAMRELAAEFAGVHWMDPVDDISKLFQEYRQNTSELMLFAYSAIAFLLCWCYRPAQAFRVLLSPALAAWITLGILGYAGVAINLFHVLALLLVLGVGIDYSIFFAESRTHRDSTMLAIVLSTITTLLSFGLLSLSETAAIRSFGIVVSLGMVCALLFSPLAQPRRHAIPTHG